VIDFPNRHGRRCRRAVGIRVEPGTEDDDLTPARCARLRDLFLGEARAHGQERAHLRREAGRVVLRRVRAEGGFHLRPKIRTASGSTKTAGASSSWCAARCSATRSAQRGAAGLRPYHR